MPDVFVELLRVPGLIWIDGQNTNANGAYRLSVSPGTYRLRVRPSRGPLIAQNREELALSTNTTRNVVLETGVTLAGRVTGPAGQAVPRAWVSVHTDAYQEVGFGLADASGHYSLGVPVGTYQVHVYSEDFTDRRLEGVEVNQGTVLNITLEAGALLEGRVVDDGDQPVPDAQVCAHLSTEAWWENPICSTTTPAGSFQLRVPPADYVVRVRPAFPLQPTRLRLEVSEEGVAALVLTVSRQPLPFVPDDPPKADLISVSPPTADGEVTLTGTAGSLPPVREPSVIVETRSCLEH